LTNSETGRYSAQTGENPKENREYSAQTGGNPKENGSTLRRREDTLRYTLVYMLGTHPEVYPGVYAGTTP